MRVFRAGGLTKDLVYLRGLVDLLAHVRHDHALDALWLGKMALDDVPLVEELAERVHGFVLAADLPVRLRDAGVEARDLPALAAAAATQWTGTFNPRPFNAEAALAKDETYAALRSCLEQLSPAHREIVDLVYYHGRTIEEAAAIVRVPVGTAKTRMFYARKQLRSAMEARGEIALEAC